MSLTGTPFLYTTIALAVIALVLPFALWTRMKGPKALRAAARALMLLFAQATAITLVFVLVNNSNNLYDNWADLLGTGNHVQKAADLGATAPAASPTASCPRSARPSPRPTGRACTRPAGSRSPSSRAGSRA